RATRATTRAGDPSHDTSGRPEPRRGRAVRDLLRWTLSYGARVPAKRRIDLLLVERALAPTRAQAQALILAGKVYTGDRRIDKAGTELDPNIELTVREPERFVSRGGHKLEGALDALGCHVEGAICADVG